MFRLGNPNYLSSAMPSIGTCTETRILFAIASRLGNPKMQIIRIHLNSMWADQTGIWMPINGSVFLALGNQAVNSWNVCVAHRRARRLFLLYAT